MTISPSSFTDGDLESDGPPPFFRFFFKGRVRCPSAFFLEKGCDGHLHYSSFQELRDGHPQSSHSLLLLHWTYAMSTSILLVLVPP